MVSGVFGFAPRRSLSPMSERRLCDDEDDQESTLDN